ncbi:tellurite resistance/C4-dicarboxylate transporter family protein [Parafrigoribacterium soli]|uniref:tellurite resistance/C4-dicarboxylate transporter family protein n=1 Tax=Parafrigoribacterium soli TaxID=3144663 RepID=UPI0032EFFCE5
MTTTAPQRLGQSVKTLTPGYFAVTMASGIISVGMRLEGFELISMLLLVVCAASFVLLLVLNVWRALAHPSAIREDFMDPRRAFGFFTFVAGADVLGVRLDIAGYPVLTAVLLLVAGGVFLVIGYVIPWTAALSKQKQSVVATANGTWFIWVVASQSIAIVAATLETTAGAGRAMFALIAVVAWSVGVLLYGATAVFVALRLMLYPFGPEEFTPPYWVTMGALAITVLAGARIVDMAQAPMVAATGHLIAGLSVVFWGIATWLIPPLIAAGLWRHVLHRITLRYEATLWSIIFPLGMYAVASLSIGATDNLPIVLWIGKVELWVALAAWLGTFVAMTYHVVRTLMPPRAVSAE